jgi:hypothetical protein
VLTTVTIKIDPNADPWALRALVNHSGVSIPESEFAVEPSDFEGLLMFINVKHAPGKYGDRIFVNASFVSRGWAIQQNGALALAVSLFKNVRTPGTFKQVTPQAIAQTQTQPVETSLSSPPIATPESDRADQSAANEAEAIVIKHSPSVGEQPAKSNGEVPIPPLTPESAGRAAASSEEMATLFNRLSQPNGGRRL